MTTRPPDPLDAPLGKFVYRYVRQSGGVNVPERRDALGVPQLQLYPAVARLHERELIERRRVDVREAGYRTAEPMAL